MKTFAVLNNENVVINTIVADTLEIAETATGAVCIEFDETNPTGFGQIWDGEKFNSPLLQTIIDVEEVTPTPALEG
jgi:hypothetical protein